MQDNTNAFDIGAIVIWIASLANILPSIAAVLSIIWFAIRIAESESFQQLIGSYRWMNKDKQDDAE